MQAHGVTPILNVSDLEASFAWFGKLGWSKLWDWGDPPSFGAVGSGACEIFLSQDKQGARAEIESSAQCSVARPDGGRPNSGPAPGTRRVAESNSSRTRSRWPM